MPVSNNNAQKLYGISLLGGLNLLEPVMTFFYLSVGLNYTDIFVVLLCFSVSILIFEIRREHLLTDMAPKSRFSPERW